MTDKPRSEHIEQREFVQWVRQMTPYLIYAIPNGGGKRTKADGGRLKAEGVVSGMPDLHIPELRLWIEMKKKGGTVEPEQRAIHEKLRAFDMVSVCYSTADAVDLVTSVMRTRGMVPTRQPLKKVVKNG
jgi:hypothetical protein